MTGLDAPTEISIPRRLIRNGYIEIAGPAWKTEEGVERFTLFIPVDLLGDPSTQVLLRDEYAGDGYEARERRLTDRLLPPDCLFLDIGAHWGIYSLHALTASADIQVVAVEPDPNNLIHLKHNLAANRLDGRAKVVAAAVADRAGSQWLKRNTAMGHHLFEDRARAGCDAIAVPTVTIDDLVAESDPNGVRPVWIKLDIEGRERAALAGAVTVLRAGRVAGILWESNAGGMVNPETEDIIAVLFQHGFTTHEVNQYYRLSVPHNGAALNLGLAASLERPGVE
jgi:FkbM family methyltransferase